MLELDEGRLSLPVLRGLRHETMDVSVMTDRSGHNPVCDHRYPTKTCGRGNPAVRSSWDNVSSPEPGGRVSREGFPTTASVKAVGGQGGWHG